MNVAVNVRVWKRKEEKADRREGKTARDGLNTHAALLVPTK